MVKGVISKMGMAIFWITHLKVAICLKPISQTASMKVFGTLTRVRICKTVLLIRVMHPHLAITKLTPVM